MGLILAGGDWNASGDWIVDAGQYMPERAGLSQALKS
jgi:hypothetical protein